MLYASQVASRERSNEIGSVAQLVAHLHGMQGVRGSSPLRSTIFHEELGQSAGLFVFHHGCHLESHPENETRDVIITASALWHR